MRDKSHEGSDERRQQLVFWRELAGGAVGQESGNGDSDEGMKSIPDQVEGGNLIREELDYEQRYACCDQRPALKELQSRRKREMGEAGQESQDSQRRVKIQAGGEADSDEEREKLGLRDLEDVEHQRR